MSDLQILVGDCRETLKQLPDKSVQTCVTSPPYFGLRDYGHDGQIGMEQTPQAYVDQMVEVFREVHRVLREDGTLWLNLGDSYCNSNGYASASEKFQRKGRNNAPANDRNLDALHAAGIKTKDIIGIPWMVAFALRADGWCLRQDIIWHKPNPMPESVEDRCTKSHEYIFLMSKSTKYYFDNESIKEKATSQGKFNGSTGVKSGANGDRNDGGRCGIEGDGTRNKRDVWSVNVQPYKGSHFATFPEELIKPCILAGSKAGDIVLDPFGGSGTTGKVAIDYGRRAILCELNPEYVKIINERTNVTRGFQF
jgi:site-specific DNA-methyltransferase (adenine-specific)